NAFPTVQRIKSRNVVGEVARERMANVKGGQTAFERHVPGVVAALSLDEVVAGARHTGTVVHGLRKSVGNLHQETVAETLLQAHRNVVVITVRVRILIANLREYSIDASGKLRAGARRKHLLIARNVVWETDPAVHIRLRLLPEMQRARTRVTRYHSPSRAQFTLEGQAPAVDVSRVLLVIDHSSGQATTLEQTCDCRIVNGAWKGKRNSSTSRVGCEN